MQHRFQCVAFGLILKFIFVIPASELKSKVLHLSFFLMERNVFSHFLLAFYNTRFQIKFGMTMTKEFLSILFHFYSSRQYCRNIGSGFWYIA